MQDASGSERLKIVLALLALYLVWGSTYLAIKVAVVEFPPFGMAGLRFTTIGGLLFLYLRWRGAAMPEPSAALNSAVTGVLLLAAGNGVVCYAQQSVSSSLTAVALASMPLFAAVMSCFFRQWPSIRDWLGLAIGFSGVILLNLGSDLRASPVGALALIVAPLAWAFGSVWSRQRHLPEPWMNAAIQMMAGGVFLWLIFFGLQERMPRAPSWQATAALLYLGVAGSLVGFSAYIYLLNKVRPALAMSYAYVNPPVAIALGVLLGGESFGFQEGLATAIMLVGVVVIITAKRS